MKIDQEVIGCTINGISYDFKDNNKASIVGYEFRQFMDLELPGIISFKGIHYEVTEIEREAFKRCRFIRKLVIPDTIKKVGIYAFADSDFEEIYFESSNPASEVSLGNACFMFAIRLRIIELPIGLKKIPDHCFQNCISLTHVRTNNLIEEIGVAAFDTCESLCHFDFTNSITKIDDFAFQGSNLYYAEVGPNVEWVGDLAFADIENLSVLIIVATDAIFGDYFVENDCRVTIYINANEESYDSYMSIKPIQDHHYKIFDEFTLFEEDGIKYLLMSNKEAVIASYLEREIGIRPNVSLKNYVGPYKVSSFEPGFFKYSRNVKICTFPSSITSIKGKVFEECPNIETVIFNNKLSKSESEWVVSNTRAKIILVNEKIEKYRYSVLLECIYNNYSTLEDSKDLSKEQVSSEKEIWLQKTHHIGVDAVDTNDALKRADLYCKENSNEDKKYSIVGEPIKHPIEKYNRKPLSGKYFIVNGEIFIETSEDEHNGLHKIMFEKIIDMYPQYSNYSYLYFPRGIVVADKANNELSLVSGPELIDHIHRRRVARSFEAVKYYWEYDEHYNFDYVEKKIRDDLSNLPKESIDKEVAFAKHFFEEQVRLYTGRTQEIFI